MALTFSEQRKLPVVGNERNPCGIRFQSVVKQSTAWKPIPQNIFPLNTVPLRCTASNLFLID